LLVVIAIIAILAAILFPVFAKVREKARQTACLSNCRQIGTATACYVQDYDETFPYAWYVNTSAPTLLNFTGAIDSYIKASPNMANEAELIKTHNIWTCPSDSTGIGISYAANPMLFGGGYDGDLGWHGSFIPKYYMPSASVAAIDSPADVIAIGEVNKIYDGADAPNQAPTDYFRPCAGDDDDPVACDSDKAVQKYQNYLHYDLTDLHVAHDACPVAGNWRACKAPAYRHVRSGAHSGICNFTFADGHSKGLRFGTVKPHNFFPRLTDSQKAAYDN